MTNFHIKAGTVLRNRYKVGSILGEGGMGRVYLCFDIHLSKEFVVKELDLNRSPRIDKGKAIEWFYREAKILSNLRHPNIPVVIDFFKEGENFYIVMDYIKGKNMAEIPLPLSFQEVYNFAMVGLDILEYLHSHHILHRDIKTEHFIIEEDTEKIFLVDFGIARSISTKGVTAIGTVGFTPPEQYEGKVSYASDIYSFGATLYHLITGINPANMPPFSFESVEKIVTDVPPRLAYAINKALAYDVSHRFSSAKEMREFLTEEKNKTSKKAKVTSYLPPEPEYYDYNIIRPKPIVDAQDISIKGKGKYCLHSKFFSPMGMWILNIHFVHPGTAVLVCLVNGEMFVWDVEKREKVLDFKPIGIFSSVCTSVAVSEDGTLVAQGFDNHQIIIWDIITARKVKTLREHRGSVEYLQFVGNNRLVSIGREGALMVWDLVLTNKIGESEAPPSPSSMAFSLRKDILFAGDNSGKIWMWEGINTGSLSYPLVEIAHRGGVRGMDVVKDEDILITGGEDGILKVWHIKGEPPVLLKSVEGMRIGKGIVKIGVKPMSKEFISITREGEVRMWQIPLNSIHVFDELKGKDIKKLAFSPSGKLVAFSQEEGQIFVYTL